MAIVTELVTDAAKSIAQQGSKISAGSSSTKTVNKTIVAQYPAERAAANDGSSDLRVNDLYKNGLLFTAYDFKSRTTAALRKDRSSQNSVSGTTILNGVKTAVTSTTKALASLSTTSKTGLTANTDSTVDKTPLVNILLPRSKSDVDTASHRFNDVGESLIARGGGNVGGVLSNIASTAVFGAIDSLTQGIMADHSEQIYNTARSMYAGADNRTKVFTWDLTPRNGYDLNQIIKIYELFNYYSYGETGNSTFAKEMKAQLDQMYKDTFINNLTPEGSDRTNTIFENVTSFLSNVIVVGNPTIWYVRNFGTTSSYDGRTDVFGPCQIQSVRFDKSPNGQFNGLAIAPNLPSTFTLEVTFREILTLDRGSLYASGIS